MTIRFSPPAAVTSALFARDGVTAPLTPVFETQVATGVQRSWIVTFDETDDPLMLDLDPPPHGQLIGRLSIQLSPGFDADTLELLFVRGNTVLGNQAGTIVETQANGQLTFVDGSVYVDSDGIFADGFETDDTSAWSVTIP